MAVTKTLRGHPTATSGTLVSDTFTPSSGEYLVVFASLEATNARTLSIADTFGDTGGTAWASEDSTDLALGVGHVRVYKFSRKVGTGAGSGAATVTASGTYSSANATFFQVAGQGSSPEPQAAAFANLSSVNAVTTFASPPTLGSAPASGAVTFGYLIYRGTNTAGSDIAAGSGYTEVAEDAIGTTRAFESEFASTASQSANWTWVSNASANRYVVGVIVEIAGPSTVTLGSLEMHATAADTVGTLTQTVHPGSLEVHATAADTVGVLKQTVNAGSLEAHATASDTVGTLTQTVHTGALEAHASAAATVGPLKQSSTFGPLESHAQGVIDVGSLGQVVGFGGLDLSATGVIDIAALVQSVSLGDLDLTAFGDIEAAIGVTVLGMLSLSATASVDVGGLVQSIDAGVLALDATADIEAVLTQLVGLGTLDLEALAEWLVGEMTAGHEGPPFIPGPRLSLAGSNSAGLAGSNDATLGGSNTAGI